MASHGVALLQRQDGEEEEVEEEVEGCAGVAVDVLWQVLGVKRVVGWWW